MTLEEARDAYDEWAVADVIDYAGDFPARHLAGRGYRVLRRNGWAMHDIYRQCRAINDLYHWLRLEAVQ